MMAILPRKQPTLPHHFIAKLALQPIPQHKPRIRREPDAKVPNCLLIQPASGKIFSRPRPLWPAQAVLEKRARTLVDIQQHCPQPRVFSFRLGAEGLLGQRDTHLLRHCPNRLGESNVLDLLDKTEHVARLSAAKAVKKLARRMHRKRRRLLFMKRTQPRVVLRPRLLQRNIVAHNADNVRLQLQALREIGGEGHIDADETLKRIVSQSGANRNIAETDCCGEAVESPSISLANEQKAAAVPAMERQGQSFSGSPGRPPAFLCRTECAVLAPVVSALGGFE